MLAVRAHLLLQDHAPARACRNGNVFFLHCFRHGGMVGNPLGEAVASNDAVTVFLARAREVLRLNALCGGCLLQIQQP